MILVTYSRRCSVGKPTRVSTRSISSASRASAAASGSSLRHGAFSTPPSHVTSSRQRARTPQFFPPVCRPCPHPARLSHPVVDAADPFHVSATTSDVFLPGPPVLMRGAKRVRRTLHE